MAESTEDQDPSKAPAFVTDQATSADSEDSPAVAPDRPEDDEDEPKKTAQDPPEGGQG